MSRWTLLALQIGVAIVLIGLWHLLTTYPILGDVKQTRFFFSTPADVLATPE